MFTQLQISSNVTLISPMQYPAFALRSPAGQNVNVEWLPSRPPTLFHILEIFLIILRMNHVLLTLICNFGLIPILINAFCACSDLGTN